MKRSELFVLLFNIIYLILFAFHFFSRGNFEFIWYIFIMFLLIGIFSFLHKKYNFTILTLIGLSIWGFGHMLGGSTLLGEPRIYARILVNLFTTGDTTLFRYDHLMHFYFYVVMTSVGYQIGRKYFNPKANWKIIATFIVFTSMGIGAFNEIIEFMPVLFLAETGVGGYYNVAWDIIFNTIGALAGITYISWKRKCEIKYKL